MTEKLSIHMRHDKWQLGQNSDGEQESQSVRNKQTKENEIEKKENRRKKNVFQWSRHDSGNELRFTIRMRDRYVECIPLRRWW